MSLLAYQRYGGSATINVMTAAILKAARGLLRDFGEAEQLKISKKGAADFVTSADKKAEKTLIQELQKARPDYGFLTEESGEIPGKNEDFRWVVDPLDGTTNFIHGIPHWSIVVALQRYNKEIIASAIYDPLRDEMFWSERGQGAFLNQHKIKVSVRSDLEECLVATGIPYGRRSSNPEFLKMCEKLIPLCAGIRRQGSAALDLAYVACGRYDAYFERACKPWDIASGILLVKEAAGHVSEIEGDQQMLETGSILASNSEIFRPIGRILRKALKEAAGKEVTERQD